MHFTISTTSSSSSSSSVVFYNLHDENFVQLQHFRTEFKQWTTSYHPGCNGLSTVWQWHMSFCRSWAFLSTV